jgi:hypothetical protein
MHNLPNPPKPVPIPMPTCTVTNPLCPPLNKATDNKIDALKRHVQRFKRQQTTHDDYEDDQEDEDMLAITRLVSADMPTMEADAGMIQTGMMVM